MALAKTGRLLDAKDAYDRAISIEPIFVEALVNRALVEMELNQLEFAFADLTRAVELGRHELPVLAARGEILARLGRREEAESDFAEMLSHNPADPVVRVARGMTRVGIDPEGARNDFESVLTDDPRHAAANYGMALLLRSKDPREALRRLDTALNTDSHLIDAIQLRALIHARLGERTSLDDVEHLLEAPTPHRLYNAACAISLYSEKAREHRLRTHAVELLVRAIQAGFPIAEAASDPDLNALHALPEFRQLMDHPIGVR